MYSRARGSEIQPTGYPGDKGLLSSNPHNNDIISIKNKIQEEKINNFKSTGWDAFGGTSGREVDMDDIQALLEAESYRAGRRAEVLGQKWVKSADPKTAHQFALVVVQAISLRGAQKLWEPFSRAAAELYFERQRERLTREAIGFNGMTLDELLRRAIAAKTANSILQEPV